MAQELKQYLEPDAEGQLREEPQEGLQTRQKIPERLQVQPEIVDQNAVDPGRNSTVVILAEQGNGIVEEWRHDLAHNTQNPRELELYFAGKIDQHNMMITLADLAHPELREALPQQLHFAEIKAALELEQTQRQQSAIAYPGMSL